MRKTVGPILLCLVQFCLTTALSADTTSNTPAATLDAFHSAASRADLDTYLGLLTTEMVFLGTDSSERWQGEQFRAFASDHFSSGRGWTYTATERHIIIPDGEDMAWFDELLDNEKLGRCRGSGVLLKTARGWRIAQYNLSIPIPNSMALSVTQEIRSITHPVPDPTPGSLNQR